MGNILHNVTEICAAKHQIARIQYKGWPRRFSPSDKTVVKLSKTSLPKILLSFTHVKKAFRACQTQPFPNSVVLFSVSETKIHASYFQHISKFMPSYAYILVPEIINSLLSFLNYFLFNMKHSFTVERNVRSTEVHFMHF